MASGKEIKKIGSVENTKKITSAMEMVSQQDAPHTR